MSANHFDPKVLSFVRDSAVRFPKPEELEVIADGLELTKVIVITMNDDGVLGHYFDGVSPYEAIGIMEDLKYEILNDLNGD